MTEIIILAATSEAALNWWKEDLLRYSKYGKPQAERQRLEIITPTCRIRYRSGRQHNEGLRADLVYGAGEDERRAFMCKSEYTKEDCTMENIRKIVIDSFKEGI